MCIQLTQFWTRTNSVLRDYYGRAPLLLPRLLKSSLQTSRRDQGKQYFGICSLGYVAAVLHRFMPTKRWTDAKGSQKHSQVSLSTSARGCVHRAPLPTRAPIYYTSRANPDDDPLSHAHLRIPASGCGTIWVVSCISPLNDGISVNGSSVHYNYSSLMIKYREYLHIYLLLIV